MFIDVGVNLTNKRFADDLEELLQQSFESGVERLVVIGTDIDASRHALALCERFPEMLWATVGVHPHDAKTVTASTLAELRDLAQHPAVRAIGECGLDYNRMFSPRDTQLDVFEQQLQLAAELRLPVYLHERDALEDQLELLSRYRAEIPRLLTHCFTGGTAELARYLELDCYIGITGWLCDERRGKDLQQALPMIPKDRLLLETDAPYLLPRSLRPKPKSSRNEPKYLPHIATVAAQLRDESVNELAAQSWQASMTFFARQEVRS